MTFIKMECHNARSLSSSSENAIYSLFQYSSQWEELPTQRSAGEREVEENDYNGYDAFYTQQRQRRQFAGMNYTGEYVFEQLSPDCTYRVRISTRNEFGWTDEPTEFAFSTSDRGEKSF